MLVTRQYFTSWNAVEAIDVSAFKQEIAQLAPVEPSFDERLHQRKAKKVSRHFPPKNLRLKINEADTADWKQLKGIGSVFANRICKYRTLLGGFYAKEQLLEVYGLDTARFLEIKQQLIVDADALLLIDLNNANLKALRKHPYLTHHQARVIVKYREQHGPYQSIADIQKIDLIEPADFRKIAPYLIVHDQPTDSVRN